MKRCLLRLFTRLRGPAGHAHGPLSEQACTLQPRRIGIGAWVSSPIFLFLYFIISFFANIFV